MKLNKIEPGDLTWLSIGLIVVVSLIIGLGLGSKLHKAPKEKWKTIETVWNEEVLSAEISGTILKGKEAENELIKYEKITKDNPDNLKIAIVKFKLPEEYSGNINEYINYFPEVSIKGLFNSKSRLEIVNADFTKEDYVEVTLVGNSKIVGSKLSYSNKIISEVEVVEETKDIVNTDEQSLEEEQTIKD